MNMADIITVTDEMTEPEKEKAREHNRKLMYKQMEEEDKKRECASSASVI